ncbi:MAG: hypothetical protein DCC75_06220 [Proteobacteria bacterium]|nr:MAG: hypothetical protein DCC75_06220 [Pseudomonadota bacterium]
MKGQKKSIKHLDPVYVNQVNVLRALCQEGTLVGQGKQLDITQIANVTGLGDEKEVLRLLYILEGHKLVSPFPAGDFTSKIWQVTDDGLKVYRNIASELVQ